jgi:hypothetical protein
VRPKFDPKQATSDEALKYATDLKEYEAADAKYKEFMAERSKESNRIHQLTEELIREESGLNDIPEQYRDKTYSYAYNQSHGFGMQEVYHTLLDLVEIFK